MSERAKEQIIGEDIQGWPIWKMTLRDILKELKFEKMSNEGVEYWRIADNNPLLDICPRVLEDDGMGYGVNEQRIIEFCPVPVGDEPKWINVFIDKEDKEYMESLKKE